MKEDLKRRLWAVGLSFLVFFLEMPVAAAMCISSLMRDYRRWVENGVMFSNGMTAETKLADGLRNLMEGLLGLGNAFTVFVMVMAALVLALTGFMYLHSKKQMDFYHSIPVRREVIFAVKYLNGFLIPAAMYLLNMILAFCVFAANGVSLSLMFDVGFVTFFVHMTGFLLCYGLMTIAVMLTGNFFISILGGIVLFSYVPAILGLLEGLIYMFFPTANMRLSRIGSYMIHGSPIPYYVSLVGEGADLKLEQYGAIMGRTGAAFLVVLVLTAVALFLYKFRPSESAGKAMAFKITRAPIKFLLVVPITICMTVLFWNIYYSIPWAVFGFLFGLLITHGIIEIIYHFEFRKLFANPVHIGICAVLSLAVIGVFRYDLIGYDSFLPSEEKFLSASVYGGSLRSWNDYGLPFKRDDESGYGWSYMDSGDYAAGNMEITDYALVKELAEAGIANAKRERELRFTGDEADAEQGYWTSMEVGYRLKSGKMVFRNYNVNITALRDAFERLYVNEEYKRGSYPVLSYEADNITGIYESRDYKIQRVSSDKETVKQILDTYKEELTALTLAERGEEAPVTSLRFLTVAEQEYLHNISVSKTPNFTGEFNLGDMTQVNFFPVYPSFTKTIALLEDAGIEIFEKVPVDDVERIEIRSDYFDYYNDEDFEGIVHEAAAYSYDVDAKSAGGDRVITIKNDGSPEAEKKIQEILDAVVLVDMANLNGLQSREQGFSISVYRRSVNAGKDPAEEEASRYLFKADMVPQFVADAVNYDQIETKHLNSGLNGNN